MNNTMTHDQSAMTVENLKLPAPSSTMVLMGFEEGEHKSAQSLLIARGFRVVRSITVAQFVVTGPRASSSLADTARSRGIGLLSWDGGLRDLLQASSGIENCGANAEVPVAVPPPRLLYERTADGYRVMDIYLNAAGSGESDVRLVPPASRFELLCYDQSFANTLLAVSLGVSQNMPVALEGETAASKTTAVLFLAHLLGRSVYRLNLNGQTDAGELVGRFVPSASGGWSFAEGALPLALRNGWWVLMDEINLGEPQILERLNSVLENPPTLVVTEGPGTVFGQSGDVQVAEAFRIFATLNPSEYSGRNVLSAAFRDRFSIWHHSEAPGERDYHAMLRLLAFGEQPVVRCGGQAYQAASSEPQMPALQELPDAEVILKRLALFHESLSKAANGADGAPGLGRNRRERYSFTRKSLLNAVKYTSDFIMKNPAVAAIDTLREALQVFYVGRIAGTNDRRAVQNLLKIAGL